MKRLLSLFVILLLLCPAALAHPGGTDSSGGHIDKSTGQYHYHHGYPAHQHKNGECPYDFDDKTGQSSGSTGNKSSMSDAGKNSGEKTKIASRSKPTENSWKEFIHNEDAIACVLSVGFFAVISIGYWIQKIVEHFQYLAYKRKH